MTQLVDFTCQRCNRLMGMIDMDAEDHLVQQDRLFFSGLGQWNRTVHESWCPVINGDHPHALSLVTAAHVPVTQETPPA